MLTSEDCIFYTFNTIPNRKLYLKAEKNATKQARIKISKPVIPQARYYATQIISSMRTNSLAWKRHPDFLAPGGMIKSRDCELASVKQLVEDVEIVNESLNLDANEKRTQTSSKQQSSFTDSDIQSVESRASVKSRDSFQFGSKDDIEYVTSNEDVMRRSMHCRRCGEGGHLSYACSNKSEEVFFCHVCQTFGYDHVSLICSSRALKCRKCDQPGHENSLCITEKD